MNPSLLIRPMLNLDPNHDGGAGGGGQGGGGSGGAGGSGGSGSASGQGGGGGASGDNRTPEEIAKYFKDEAQRAFKARDEANARLREIEESLNGLRAKEAEREAAEAKAKEEEQQRLLKEKGQFEEALKLKEQQYGQELAKLKQRAQQAAIERVRADVRASLATIEGIVPEAVDDAATVIVGQIGLDENYSPFVKGDDGQPLKNREDPRKLVTISEFVKGYVANRRWMLKDRTPTGSGNAGGSADGKPSFDPAQISDIQYAKKWKEADPDGFKAAWKKHLATIAAKPVK